MVDRTAPCRHALLRLRLMPCCACAQCSQLLCGEMAESFRVMGLTLPPWRRTTSMLR